MFARAFFCNTIFTPQLETPKSVVHKKTNGRPVFGAAVRCILVKLKGYFFCFSVSSTGSAFPSGSEMAYAMPMGMVRRAWLRQYYLKEMFKRSILVFLLELCTRLACGFLEEPHQM